MPPKAFCWSHLGCIRTKFLKSWFHVIDDYRLKYFSSAGLPWSPASNSLTHHECSQLTSTSRIKVSLWLESASFMENLDESSASLKKRCKKYLGQVATISCNVSQRVSRKGCMKDNSLKFISSSCWCELNSRFLSTLNCFFLLLRNCIQIRHRRLYRSSILVLYRKVMYLNHGLQLSYIKITYFNIIRDGLI